MMKKLKFIPKKKQHSTLKTVLVSLLITSSFYTTAEIIPSEQVIKDITYLASDDLKGRASFSPEIDKAANYIAKRFADETCIICFDEFFVSDITDAMILGTLFEELFAHNVTLVATSNIIPDELYRNGLQRERFLPAIKLINECCDVINVDSGVDYRLRTLEQAELFHFPLDKKADENLNHYFQQLATETGQMGKVITINNRSLATVQESDGVVHFEFSTLCESARSQGDYMELSRLYHTVLLANVTQMGVDNDDSTRRFIALVDEFYERHVKLIISAEVALEELYVDGRLTFEFKRCLSRLQEMQSYSYLASEHLP